jgi:AcrR family transcriptional regulator
MNNKPTQARSIDSTSRMLDAGEQLFLEGGGTLLKLNLILERSGSSTGSFYARFGDMQGYLDALHHRALDRVEEALAEVIKQAAGQTSVLATMDIDTYEFLKVLRKFKGTLYFFAVGNAQLEFRQSRGTQFILDGLLALTNLMGPFLLDPSNPEVVRRLDMMTRLLAAMGFQQIMFEQEEISTLKLTDKELAHEWAAALSDSIAAFVK